MDIIIVTIMALFGCIALSGWAWLTNDSLGTLAQWQFVLDHPELWLQALWEIFRTLFLCAVAVAILSILIPYQMRGGKTRAELEAEGNWKK